MPAAFSRNRLELSAGTPWLLVVLHAIDVVCRVLPHRSLPMSTIEQGVTECGLRVEKVNKDTVPFTWHNRSDRQGRHGTWVDYRGRTRKT